MKFLLLIFLFLVGCSSYQTCIDTERWVLANKPEKNTLYLFYACGANYYFYNDKIWKKED